MTFIILRKDDVIDELKGTSFIFISDFETWPDDTGTTGPPPYQQPPSYANTSAVQQTEEPDPFDTSKVNMTPLHRYYSQIPPISTVYQTTNNLNSQSLGYIKSDITNRSINLSYSSAGKSTNLAVSVNVASPQKEVAVAPSKKLSEMEPKVNLLDKKLIEELENLNLSKTESNKIPLIQPPPPSVKIKKINDLNSKNTNVLAASLPKVQKSEANFSNYSTNHFDVTASTAQVYNNMWLQSVEQNGATSEFGEFKCNQSNFRQLEPLRTSSATFSQPVYSNGDSSMLYSNEPASVKGASDQSYSAYYLPNNGQYSEVAESVYTEIPDYMYSQVPDDILKPHRPAPPSPMILVAQPQSMQQVQRKMQVSISKNINKF